MRIASRYRNLLRFFECYLKREFNKTRTKFVRLQEKTMIFHSQNIILREIMNLQNQKKKLFFHASQTLFQIDEHWIFVIDVDIENLFDIDKSYCFSKKLMKMIEFETHEKNFDKELFTERWRFIYSNSKKTSNENIVFEKSNSCNECKHFNNEHKYKACRTCNVM